MIKVLIKKDSNRIVEIEVSGHAEYNDKGKDIVCAGVSAVTIGALNNLNHKDFSIKVEEGYIDIKPIKEISHHDQIVLETMIIQLQSIEETYGDFITIK